jgi:hypothetical protein
MAVDRSPERYEGKEDYDAGFKEGVNGNVIDDALQGALENLQDEDYAQGYADGEHERKS